MKQFVVLAVLCAFAACEVGKWGVEEDENVAVLTDDNFEEFAKNNSKFFVKFYAPWCGHCKAMAPAYSSLAKRMKEKEDGIPITKVDATIQKVLAEKYGVQGFPTLKFFVDGEPVDYQGAREEEAIYNWINKKTGPSSTELTTDEQLKTHSEASLSVLFLVPQDDEALKTYMNLAMGYDDVSFAHSFSEDHKKTLEVSAKYALVVFRDFDDGKKLLVLEEAPKLESLKNFIEGVRYPTVMNFDQNAAERIFGSQASAMIFFSDDAADAGLQDFKAFAGKNKGKIIFAYSTVTTDLGEKLSEFIGINKDNSPCVRIIKFKDGQLDKYVIDDLEEGLTKFLSDDLKAYYKSEPIPETNDEPVKIVVGNSFEEMVLKSDKFVLLEAYAPWCGHCKALTPIYIELAEKLSAVEDVVIAKMDATANETPSLQIQGFPTIKLYKPDSETPVDYTGDRSLEDLVKFLQTETGKKFEEFKTEEM